MAISTINSRQYEAAIGNFPTIQRSGLRKLRSQEDLIIVSDTITTVAQSSTAFVNTSEYVIDNLPTGVYRIRADFALAIGAAGNNIKFDFSGGTLAGTAVGRAFFGLTATAPLEVAIAALNTSISGATTSAWTSFSAWFTLTVTNPGSLIMRAAQAASGATDSSVSIGSTLECRRVI